MNNTLLLNKSVFEIDIPSLSLDLERYIKENFDKNKYNKIVIGISGGLDSSVIAALCVKAVGKTNVIGLMMPERGGNPEAKMYGELICRHLGIESKVINISPILRGLRTADLFLALISGRKYLQNIINKHIVKRGHTIKSDFLDYLHASLNMTKSKRSFLSKVNAKQRARALVIFKYADENNALVVGSAHKTEQSVGLFCKYGIDHIADMMPFKNIYRSHILQLARNLQIPDQIINRTPNPDILPAVVDKYQSYFGVDAAIIDLILYGFNHQLSNQVIAKQLNLKLKFIDEIKEITVLTERLRNVSIGPDIVT